MLATTCCAVGRSGYAIATSWLTTLLSMAVWRHRPPGPVSGRHPGRVISPGAGDAGHPVANLASPSRQTEGRETAVAQTAPTGVPQGGRTRGEPSGWIVFAATMLFLVGMFDAIWGLGAVLNDKVVTAGGSGAIVLDITVWGWVHIVIGLVMIATSVGLFMMKGFARWFGIFFAAVSAILQVGVLTAFPIWGLIVIALDVVVIYQLTVRWDAAY